MTDAGFREDTSQHTLADLLQRTNEPILDGPGGLLGIEHEFDIVEGPRRCDFRTLIHDVAAHAPRTSWPMGPYAYMFDGGTLLICDGREAEIAIPPVPIGADTIDTLASRVAAHHRTLGAALEGYNQATGARLRARGYSTHFSFSAALVNLDALCRLYARSMAPAMMLFEGLAAETPGLLVRPRNRRFEICSEFVPASDALTAATVFALGSFLAVVDARSRSAGRDLPCAFDPQLVVTRQRFGYFVERSAFGDDLYAAGRDAVLRLADGSAIIGQEMLERCWEHARPFAAELTSAGSLSLVDDFVRGARRLPCEERDVEAHLAGCGTTGLAAVLPADPFSMQPLVHKRTRLIPHVLTWDFIVYALESVAGPAFVNVPRRHFDAFRRLYLAGNLDEVLNAATTEAHGILAAPAQAQAIGTYRSVDTEALIAPMTGGRSSDKKKKKKPEERDPLCVVEVDEEAETIDIFIPETTDPQKPIGIQEPPQNDRKVAHDIFIHNGSFATDFSDLFLHGLGTNFEFTRSYRSATRYDGIMGHCWDHQFNIRVVPHRPPAPTFKPVAGGWRERFDPQFASGSLTFHHGTGRVTEHAFRRWEIREMDWCSGKFTAVVTTYAQNDGEDFEIERYAVLSGTIPPVLKRPIFYRIRVRDGTRVLLNCHGYVAEIRDKNFNAFTFAYGSPFNGSTGFWTLQSITDSSARTHRLRYRLINNVQRIVKLIDFEGKEIAYDYDPLGQLVSVELIPGSAGRPALGYRYSPSRAGLLTEVIQPIEFAAGTSYIENAYDANERVRAQRVGTRPGVTPSAGGTFKLDYSVADQVTLTDRSGIRHRYELAGQANTNVLIAESLLDDVFENGQLQTGKRLFARYDYDRHFHVVRKQDPGGGHQSYRYRNRNAPVTAGNEYDDARLLITHWNDLGRDALEETVQSSANGQLTFVTRYEYEWLYNSVTRIVAPLGTTTFDYDHGWCHAPERNGNPIRIERPAQLQPDGTVLPVVESYLYAKGGVVQLQRMPDGEEHSFLHDDRGRQLYHFLGGTTLGAYHYDSRANLTDRYDERGHHWIFTCDDRGNVVKETDPLLHEKSATFDLNDQRIRTEATRVDDAGGVSGLTAQPTVTFEHFFSYDILGNCNSLEQTASGAGTAPSRRWRWTYDAEDRLASEETPRATAGQAADARTDYTYNARGSVYEITEGTGGSQVATARNWYTSDGELSRADDPLGRSEITVYDGVGRIDSRLAPDGTVVRYGYAGPKIEREWVEGIVETGPALLGGSPIQCVLAETHFLTDQNGNVVRRTAKDFDPLARPSLSTSVTMGDSVWSTWLSAGGKVTKERDAAGLETRHDYDAMGRLTTVTLPGGNLAAAGSSNTVSYAYEGMLTARVTTRYVPDPGFTAQPPAAPFEVTESLDYDALGRVTRRTDNRGVITQYAYDSFDNMRGARNQLSLVEQTYDGYSRCISQTRDNVLYDANQDGRIKLKFAYDLNDNQTSTTDDLGRVSTIAYDGRDRPSRSTAPDRLPIGIARYADGSVSTIDRGGGRRIEYDYTEMGLLRRTRYFDGARRTEQAYGYDGLGHVTYALDSNDTTNRNRVQRYRRYDSLGRLTVDRLVIPEFNFDERVRYDFGPSYDSRTILYPGLSPPITYQSGPDGNVKRISELQSTILSRIHQGPDRTLETKRRILLSTQNPPQQLDFGLYESFRFDGAGRVFGRVLRIEEKVIDPAANYLMPLTAAESTVFGSFGLLESRSRDGVTTTYTYDGAERLRHYTEDDGSGVKLIEFDWDGANRLHETAIVTSIGGSGGTTTINPTRYNPSARTRTDNQGSLATVSGFDVNGRLIESNDFALTAGTTRSYNYDAADRLKSCNIRVPGFFGPTKTDPLYLYDGFGRLVARVGGRDGGSLAGRPRTVFIHDGERPIVEYDEQGRQVRSYIYDDNGDLIAYRYIDPTTSRVVETHPITTMDGSPWYLLQRRIGLTQLPPNIPAPTDPLPKRQAYYREWLPIVLEQHRTPPFGANEVRRYTYNSSSAASSTVSEESLLPINSTGQLRFVPEDLQLNGHRFYYPTIRSFITPDPAGHWGDPVALGNAYAYAGNNPINFGDSSGLFAWDATSDVAFAVYGFGDAVLETIYWKHDFVRADGTKVEGWDVGKAWGFFALDLVGLLPIIPNVTRPALIVREGYKAAVYLGRRGDAAIDAVRFANRGLGTAMAGSGAVEAWSEGEVFPQGIGLTLLAAAGVRGGVQDFSELAKKYRGEAILKLNVTKVKDLTVRRQIRAKFDVLAAEAEAGRLSVGSSLNARFKRQFYTRASTGRSYPVGRGKRIKAVFASIPDMDRSTTAQAEFAKDFWATKSRRPPGYSVDHRVDLQFVEGQMVLTNAVSMKLTANSRAGDIVKNALSDLKRAGWRPGSRIGSVDITPKPRKKKI